MKKTVGNQWLRLFLCVVLIAVMALSAAGCGSKTDPVQTEETPVVCTDGSELGEGEKSFALTITDADGKETHVTIHTDAATVGEALLALDVIDGENGEYGLYVKTVNGITADYDTNGTYWAFYVDGEYAMTGVDATDITDGGSYALKVEK